MTFRTAILVAALAALATTQAAASTEPRFSYEPPPQRPETGMAIAMLHPEIIAVEDVGDIPAWDAEIDLPPPRAVAMGYRWRITANLLGDEERDPWLGTLFREQYQEKLEAALGRDIAALMAARGVEPTGDYPSYEALDAGERESVMLASVPTATLAFLRTVEEKNCSEGRCTMRGEIRIEGQVLYQLVEPVSGTTVAIRRMNVWSMQLAEPYVLESFKNPPGLWTQTRLWLGLAPPLEDTREDALVAALDQFYTKTMHGVDLMVGYDQLKTFADNIKASEGE